VGPFHRTQLAAQGYADFSLDLVGVGRLRVNVGRHTGGMKGCFRLLPASMPSVSALGLPKEVADVARGSIEAMEPNPGESQRHHHGVDGRIGALRQAQIVKWQRHRVDQGPQRHRHGGAADAAEHIKAQKVAAAPGSLA